MKEKRKKHKEYERKKMTIVNLWEELLKRANQRLEAKPEAAQWRH